MRPGSPTATGPPQWTVVGGFAVLLAGVALGHEDLTAASLLLAATDGETTGSDRTTTRILAWIAVGAAAGGALAWLVAGAVDLPIGTDAVLGLGVALGGGFGTVGRLLTAEDVEPEPETVTVDADDVETGTDAAETALPTGDDLFETHPDPVLYFTETEGGVVVRAVNPAFEETFGISTATAGDTPLSDALMTADRRAELADRAAREPTDRTVTCETVDGDARFRLRSVHLAGDHVHGYLLFTPGESSGPDGATGADTGPDGPAE